jgi:uncharacterized coiled-coil protein SlyX
MSYCESCNDLKTYAANFILNGITNTECNSLGVDTGLNPSLNPKHNNCQDLNDINDCLIGRLKDTLPAADKCDWKSFIKVLLENNYTMNKGLICSDCGQWISIHEINEQIAQIWIEINTLKTRVTNLENRVTNIETQITNILNQITDIWEEIDNLWQAILAIAGGNYENMTPGTDFTTSFYNNISSPAGYVSVSYAKIFDQYEVRVQSSVNDGTALGSPDLFQIDMRHSDATVDVPKSWLFGINFAGSFAFLNNYRIMNPTSLASNQWNVDPRNARASWQARLGLSNNVPGANAKCLFYLISYADGYNTQFYTAYSSEPTLSTGDSGINYDFSFILAPPL